MTARIGLVQCGDAKQDLAADETVAAKDLYTSSYSILKGRVCDQSCDKWYIISGEYGLVRPTEQLPSYNTDITEEDDSTIFRWHAKVSADFTAHGLGEREDVEYVVLVGNSYLDLETEYSDRTLRDIIERQPGSTWYPFEGLGGMFGQQDWLSDVVEAGELIDPDPEVYA